MEIDGVTLGLAKKSSSPLRSSRLERVRALLSATHLES